MTVDLKKDRWFIRVNSVDESIAAQNWLFQQGIYWTGNCKELLLDGNIKALTNAYFRYNTVNKSGFMKSGLGITNELFPAYEIVLEFKPSLVVSSVKCSTKETPEQIKIREIKETIEKAYEQIKLLENEV